MSDFEQLELDLDLPRPPAFVVRVSQVGGIPFPGRDEHACPGCGKVNTMSARYHGTTPQWAIPGSGSGVACFALDLQGAEYVGPHLDAVCSWCNYLQAWDTPGDVDG